jgi:hypothetical protein
MNFNKVSSKELQLSAFINPALAIRQYRMFRKGITGWVSEELIRKIDKEYEDKDETLAYLNATGVLAEDEAPVEPDDFIKEQFNATVVGVVRHNSLKLSKFEAKAYNEIFCFPHEQDATNDIATIMSFLSPCGKFDDAIDKMVQRSTKRFAMTQPLGGDDVNQRCMMFAIQAVKFMLVRNKTAYGMIAFLHTADCTSSKAIQDAYHSLACEWLVANEFKLPKNYND